MIGNLREEESSSHFSSDHAEFKASEEGNKPDNEVEDMSGEAEDGGDITVLRGEASTVIAVKEMKEGSLATGQMEVDIEDMSGEAEYGGHIPAEGVLRGEANTVIAVKEMTEEPGTAQMEVDIEDIEAVVPTEHVEGYNTWAHHVESVSSQEREEEAAGFEIILATQFPPQGGVNFIDNLR